MTDGLEDHKGTVSIDKADKGRDGKTTLGNGQAWSSPSPRGQWRTGEMGETRAPTNLAVKG